MPGASDAALNELVHQIVAIAGPLRILLFGSAARGEWHDGSDIDLLIVMPDEVDCRALSRNLYQRITGVAVPYDLVVVNVSLLREYAKTPGLVYRYALTEGAELYAA